MEQKIIEADEHGECIAEIEIMSSTVLIRYLLVCWELLSGNRSLYRKASGLIEECRYGAVQSSQIFSPNPKYESVIGWD